MPGLPSIDITTGTPANGSITVGEQFEFTTSAANQNISVQAPPASQWFSPSPTPSFNGPGHVTVTAVMTSPAGGWSYIGHNITVSGSARVHVQPSMPEAKAS